ncbi:MAG: serine-type D-Ala-D-Ala carboxypeptidase/endopeptidase [Thermoleophilaceae bacterium]|nr:serine-type D-Ala-D-Ala carboxypeptidase/endopeptidase [Thermoleophilaceae bacterium]
MANATPSRRAMRKAFDGVYQSYRNDVFGICMGALDGGRRFVKCYGRAAPGASRRPDSHTLFQIGSITKTFTATLLAVRAHDHRVAFSDPLRRYIPRQDNRSKVPSSITLLDAADHYSGLPRKQPVDPPSSLDNLFSQVGYCETTPSCPVDSNGNPLLPGAQFLYSNFAFGVLGQALATHDGFAESSVSAWEKDNRAQITGPLGMPVTRTWFGWQALNPSLFDQLRARGTTGSPPHEPNPPYFAASPILDAAGGLYSSSRDMLRWLSYSIGLSGTQRLRASHRSLFEDPTLIRSRSKPTNPDKEIGLAWNLDTNQHGGAKTTCVSKDGSSPGFTAYMVFVKERQNGRRVRRGAFVMLNNSPSNVTTPAIGTALVNALPPGDRKSHRTYTCGNVAPSPES